MYPGYFVDVTGRTFDGASGRYVLRFAPGESPPLDAFWSRTLYELPSSLLSANRLNRHLINSPMLPSLVRDADGGVTLHVQHESPGADLEPNWLPAPQGRFWMILRLYRPQAQGQSTAAGRRPGPSRSQRARGSRRSRRCPQREGPQRLRPWPRRRPAGPR